MTKKRLTQREQAELQLYWSGVNWIVSNPSDEAATMLSHMFDKSLAAIQDDVNKHRRMFETLGLVDGS